MENEAFAKKERKRYMLILHTYVHMYVHMSSNTFIQCIQQQFIISANLKKEKCLIIKESTSNISGMGRNPPDIIAARAAGEGGGAEVIRF